MFAHARRAERGVSALPQKGGQQDVGPCLRKILQLKSEGFRPDKRDIHGPDKKARAGVRQGGHSAHHGAEHAVGKTGVVNATRSRIPGRGRDLCGIESRDHDALRDTHSSQRLQHMP